MDEGRPSRTAISAARMRALHLLVDDDPKLCRDPFAALFCDTADARRVRRLWGAILQPRMTAVRSTVVVRHRYAEDGLAAAYARGVRQYVILGAGLDSFAYRRPEALRDLHVFEVDHPATQGWKRRRLAELGLATPAGLTYVPLDFETMSLGEALAAASFDRRAPAFVSWLSVLFYLTPEAAFATFRAVAASCAPGSEIAFDFILHPSGLSEAQRSAQEAVARRTAEQGEPWLTLLDPQELVRTLQSGGYDEVRYLSPAEADRRYLAGRTDGLALPASYGLMTARVAG
jgi:methyltransferase (TIGR00027 family)